MSTNSKNKIKVVLLFGPTAAGKTDLIAKLFTDRFEIINADSEHVYRGLTIGSAKPDPVLLKRVPHHLVDILDPSEQFTVGRFVHAADRLAAEIHGRGRVPVVSGGAAFYIRHFVFGLPAAPPSDPVVRTAVKRELQAKGAAVLYEELCGKDPAGAARIHPSDTYRVSRAVEVIRQTGQPLSSFSVSSKPRDRYSFLSIGLKLPREELKERINRRVDAMFSAGLENEIQQLKNNGFTENTPGLRGIGYREFFMTGGTVSTPDDIRDVIKLHSLQYAKRQLTFFKTMPDTHWFHPSEEENLFSLVQDFCSE